MYIPGTGIGFFMIWRFSVLYGIDFGAKAETCTIEIAEDRPVEAGRAFASHVDP